MWDQDRSRETDKGFAITRATRGGGLFPVTAAAVVGHCWVLDMF